MYVQKYFCTIPYSLTQILSLFCKRIHDFWKIIEKSVQQFSFFSLCVWAFYVLIYYWDEGVVYTNVCLCMCMVYVVYIHIYALMLRDQFYRIFQTLMHISLHFFTYLDKPSAILLFLIGRLNFEQSVRRFILKIPIFSLKTKFCVCSSF